MRRILNRPKLVSSCCLVGLLVLATTPVALGQDNLIADNSPAADKGGLLPSSFDTAVDKPLESVCCPSCCGPRWTASADFIILDRIGGVPYALVETVPHDQPYTNPGTEVLNANDLHEGFAAGPKLGLVRHGDNGYDLELSYFQVDEWNDYRSIGPTPDYWLVMTAPGNFIQEQDHKHTQMMAWDYSSRLYNAELNVRWHPYDRLTLLAGFRWANLSEGLQGTLPELPGTWPDRRNPFWNASVRNNLYGFQIGADGKLLERGRFSINGLIKAGIFGNDVVETTGVSIERTVYWESASTGHVAFLDETGLQCKYQVTQKLLLKLGYEAMWLQGVALAPGQISDTYCYYGGDRRNTYVQALGVNCGSGVFYHGATAGLEYSF
jgi:hypothetical protein